MIKGTPPSSPQKTQNSPFKLSKAAPSPSKLRVMMSLPDEQFLKEVSHLEDKKISKEIIDCFKLIFSHVVERGAHSQGEPQFFHHVAATSLYESYHKLLIHNKDHGVKAGAIYNKVKNALELVDKKLKKEPSLSAEQRDILEDCKAALCAHHNALVHTLKSLSSEQKQKLKQYQSIVAANLKEIPFTPKKAARLKEIHRFSPGKKSTPKKLSVSDLRSKLFLEQGPVPQAKRPLIELLEDKKEVAPSPADMTTPAQFIPRALLLKRLIPAAAKVVSSVPSVSIALPTSPIKKPGK